MSCRVIYADFGHADRARRYEQQPIQTVGPVAAIHALPRWLRVGVDVSHVDSVARHRYTRADDTPAALESYKAWLAPRIDTGQYIGYLAEIEGSIVAGAGIVLLDLGPTRTSVQHLRARLVNVFTEANYRRQGIARELICALVAKCAKLGIEEINLSTSDSDHPLWTELGFQRISSEMTLLL